MEYQRVGNSGLRISTISIGGWLTFGESLSGEESERIIRAAIQGGVNFIDLADVYAKGGAESVVGRMLKGMRRAELVVATKVFHPMSDDPNDRGLGRKHIMQSIDASLGRLGTDYVDIYFCHRHDPQTPLLETVRAMDELIRRGKVLYWGTSCWPAPVLRGALELARRHNLTAPVVEQPMYSLLNRDIERAVLPLARRRGVGVTVFSPLAGGVLTGKYNAGVPAGSRGATTQWLEKFLTEPVLGKVRSFCALAREAGMEPGELALAWCLHQPGITSVITGATSTAQVNANLKGAGTRVSDDLLARLDGLFSPPSPAQVIRRKLGPLLHRLRRRG